MTNESSHEGKYTYRFRCWARSVRKTPETALVRDEDGVPQNLFEFSLWLQACWREWSRLKGYHRIAGRRLDDPLPDSAHREFDLWLAEKVGQA
jgi:hypothetical protein